MKSWHNIKKLLKFGVTGNISDISEQSMCQLWTGGRLLECILKNRNLSHSVYEVLRTKKKQEGCMVIKLKL